MLTRQRPTPGPVVGGSPPQQHRRREKLCQFHRAKNVIKKIISGDNRIREGKNLEISSPHWGGWVLVFNCNNMGGREIFVYTTALYQKELFSCYNTLRRRNNFIHEIFGTIEGQKLCDLKYSQQQQMQDILTNFQGTIVENLCHFC